MKGGSLVPIGSRLPRVHGGMVASRAQVRLESGNVAGYMSFVAVDRRSRTATYALRLVNESSQAAQARLFYISSTGQLVLVQSAPMAVPAYSLKDTLMPIRLDRSGSFERAIVEVQTGEMLFTIEAAGPPRQLPATLRFGRIGAALAVGVAATAFAVAAAVPRVTVLASPQRVLAGTTVDIPYETTGVGDLRYNVDAADGRQISAGLTGAHAGVLHVPVPASATNANYAVHLQMHGPFGAAEQNGAFTAIAVPPAAPPRRASATPAVVAPTISGLDVFPSPAVAGQPIKIAYQSNAFSGDVWLVDMTGRTWAHAPFSPTGLSTLKVPATAAGHQMRVVLRAHRSGRDAESNLGIVVVPDAVAPGRPLAAAAPASIVLSSDRVAPGDTVTVRVSGAHGDVHIVLNDTSGNTLEQGDASADQPAVSLGIPAEANAATYYVVATWTQGIGEQSIVRKLSVVPR